MYDLSLHWSMRSMWSRITSGPAGMRPFPVLSVSGAQEPIKEWNDCTNNRCAIPWEEGILFPGTYSTVTYQANVSVPYVSLFPSMPIAVPITTTDGVDCCGKAYGDEIAWVVTGESRSFISLSASVTLELWTGDPSPVTVVASTNSNADGFFGLPGVKSGQVNASPERGYMAVSQAPDMTGRTERAGVADSGAHMPRMLITATATNRRPIYRDPATDYETEVRDMPSTMPSQLYWPAFAAGNVQHADDSDLIGWRRRFPAGNFSVNVASSGYDQVRFVLLFAGFANNEWICEPDDDPILFDDGWTDEDNYPEPYDYYLHAWYDDVNDGLNASRTYFSTQHVEVRFDPTVVGYLAAFDSGSGMSAGLIYSPLEFAHLDPVPTLADCLQFFIDDLKARADTIGFTVGYILRIRHHLLPPVTVPVPPAGELWQYGTAFGYDDEDPEFATDGMFLGIAVWSPRRDLPAPYTVALGDDAAIRGGVPTPPPP